MKTEIPVNGKYYSITQQRLILLKGLIRDVARGDIEVEFKEIPGDVFPVFFDLVQRESRVEINEIGSGIKLKYNYEIRRIFIK